MTAKGSYFPSGVNMFVSRMNYAADVQIEGRFMVALTPDSALVATAAASILSAQSIAAAGTTSTFVTTFVQDESQMGRFGRCLQVVASGAAVSLVTVRGEDYLGQPMTEQMTLNGAVPVLGVKAFRRIREIFWGLTAGTTINVGWRDALGVPYAVSGLQAGIFSELVDDVQSTAGNITAQLLTAQTITSADPRGIYAPIGNLPNSSRKYKVFYEPNRIALHGLAHFFS